MSGIRQSQADDPVKPSLLPQKEIYTKERLTNKEVRVVPVIARDVSEGIEMIVEEMRISGQKR